MFKQAKGSLAVTLSLAMVASMVTIPQVATAATTSSQLSGLDRYKTSLAIVQAGWEEDSSKNVVIASGETKNMADALAAAPLAYKMGEAPILLTKTDAIPDGVLEQLTRLGVEKVTIVGGESAVSATVEAELKATGVTVERVSGADRFETSLEIAKAAFGTTSTEVVIANGLASADALSISAIAANKGMPILLVNNKTGLTVEQKDYISGKTVYAVGGTTVLSEAVVGTATRLSGANRYETNAAILAEFAPDYSKIFLAKGTDANLVDALVGSAYAAKGNSPIVLVDGNNKIDTDLQAVVKANITGNSAVVTFGGTVTQAAVDTVETFKVALEAESVDAITVQSVTEGTVPTLPTTVNVTLSDGTITVATITWNAVATAVATYTNSGTVTVNGTLADYSNYVVSTSVTVNASQPYVPPTTNPVAPVAPSVTNDDALNTVTGMTTAMEYKLDATDYVVYDETAFALLDFTGNKTLLVRVAAEGINPVSADTTLTFTTNPVAPVESVSAINDTTLSVTFEGMDAVEITLPALVDGQTSVTFTYEAKEYTGTLATPYVTVATAAYTEVIAGVETAVVAYEGLANADLSTQELVDAAIFAKTLVSLDGLTAEDTTAFEERVSVADEAVAAAQTEITEAADQLAADAVDTLITALPAVGTVALTAQTQIQIEEARAAYDALTPAQQVLVVDVAALEAAETELAVLVDEAADAVLLGAAEDAVAALEAAIDTEDLTVEENLAAAEVLVMSTQDAIAAAVGITGIDAISDKLTTATLTVTIARTALVATVANVSDIGTLTAALENADIKTINVTTDIVATAPVVVGRAVTINGGLNTISFTGLGTITDLNKVDDGLIIQATATINELNVDAGLTTPATWVGTYAIHVYNTTATLNNVTATNGNGAILVNSSTVTLTGTVDVAGNGFGGIEVSKSADFPSTVSSLIVTGATLTNSSETPDTPSVWIIADEGTVTSGLTVGTNLVSGKTYYYVTPSNAL